MSRIYFDNAATTPLDPEVMEIMVRAYQELHGNPSSIHEEGRRARAAIEQARKEIAVSLNSSIGEIFFTSGGTEANNMALKCAVRDLGVQRIISAPNGTPLRIAFSGCAPAGSGYGNGFCPANPGRAPGTETPGIVLASGSPQNPGIADACQ